MFTQVQFYESKLICFLQNGEDKIVLTQELLPRVLKYYHKAMYHAESAGRSSQTLKRHYYHQDMGTAVKQHIEQCTTCSKIKRGTRVYGETAPRYASAMPWQVVHCDSIVPWKTELASVHAKTLIHQGRIRSELDIRQGSDNHNNMRGDVMIQCLWDSQVDDIIDFKIGDADADTYKYKPIVSLLVRWENIKKDKHSKHCHDQQKHFSPFVISVDRMLRR